MQILCFLNEKIRRHCLEHSQNPTESYPDYQAANVIAEKIKEHFSISLCKYEREYIALLLISKANIKPSDSYHSATFVSEPILSRDNTIFE